MFFPEGSKKIKYIAPQLDFYWYIIFNTLSMFDLMHLFFFTLLEVVVCFFLFEGRLVIGSIFNYNV